MRFAGKSALITGTAQRIGRAFAETFARKAVPFGRMGVAESLTRMAVFLATDETKPIVSQFYIVDDGQWMN